MNRPDLDAISQLLVSDCFADGEPLVAEVHTLVVYARSLERLVDGTVEVCSNQAKRIKELEAGENV